MSARLRDTAEELFDMLGAPFTYWLALVMAYLSWQYLPPHIGFVVVMLVIAALVADEIAEARRA